MRVRCFLLRVYGNEYLGCEAALVMIPQEYLHTYRERYIPAYKALHEKDDGFMYLVTTDHMVSFIETVNYDIVNDPTLDAEITMFTDGNVDVVEIPREQFDRILKAGDSVVIAGYGYASIDDEGVHWTLNEKHTGEMLETTKLSFKLMEEGIPHGTTGKS